MSEQNTYGLSEGVYQACLYLGLNFPTEIQTSRERVPSDYFGDNFKLNLPTAERLQGDLKCSKKDFANVYKNFSDIYLSQKCFKCTLTDLNVYFCDYLLFVARQLGALINDYFDFEFYRKSFALRKTFMVERERFQRRMICNDYYASPLLDYKPKTNKLFSEFLRRDWLDTCNCNFGEFKQFIEKHPQFFSKPVDRGFGMGAEIITLKPNTDLENLFVVAKQARRLFEEILTQHESLKAFCPDTVNTIRINTFLDIHNVVHILTTAGRFGRVGKVVDNFHGGGFSVIIDPKTGIITSDAINGVHERVSRHPDTGKTFKGFQYPSWKKIRATVTEMAKMIPQVRHIGWDIAINEAGEPVLVEANVNSAVDVQQAPDDTGRLYLYEPLLEEMQSYKMANMRLLGYRINRLQDFYSAYETNPDRQESILRSTMGKLIPNCTSLIDLGCRKAKIVKSLCPAGVKYYPVDYKAYDAEVTACDFNDGDFPDVTADVCLCALTAEYVEPLPKFLADMCRAAQKQILMLCRPVDKEIFPHYRWANPFLTDFTEEFLLKVMEQNDFRLNVKYSAPDNKSVILYDFRRE